MCKHKSGEVWFNFGDQAKCTKCKKDKGIFFLRYRQPAAASVGAARGAKPKAGLDKHNQAHEKQLKELRQQNAELLKKLNAATGDADVAGAADGASDEGSRIDLKAEIQRLQNHYNTTVVEFGKDQAYAQMVVVDLEKLRAQRDASKPLEVCVVQAQSKMRQAKAKQEKAEAKHNGLNEQRIAFAKTDHCRRRGVHPSQRSGGRTQEAHRRLVG